MEWTLSNASLLMYSLSSHSCLRLCFTMRSWTYRAMNWRMRVMAVSRFSGRPDARTCSSQVFEAWYTAALVIKAEVTPTRIELPLSSFQANAGVESVVNQLMCSGENGREGNRLLLWQPMAEDLRDVIVWRLVTSCNAPDPLKFSCPKAWSMYGTA